MSTSGWLIAISVFVIILFLALGVGWYIRNTRPPATTPPNVYNAPLVWSQPVPGPNPATNTCQLYEFPTDVINIAGVPTAVPGNPTFNPAILNGLQGTPNFPLCLDPDQIMAQQVQHTCTAPNGVVDGAITRCFLLNGGTTGLGGSEVFFSDVNCLPLPTPCAGVLSLVSINFQAPSNQNINCIQNEGTGNNVTMQDCDPSVSDQLFRVTRIDPGQNPNALQPGQGQNGLIAQILDRNTGLCLVAGTGTTTTQYDPSYLGSGCSGPITPLSGRNVVMGECTGGIYPGYLWAMLPSIEYCGEPGGCNGCTGCLGCQRISTTNTCIGCPGCTGFESMVTPPQIVYVGDLDLNNLPVGPTGYQGLTGDNAVFKWLLDNNAKALYYGGAGTELILTEPIGLDVSVCKELPFVAQYMSITAYNTISQENVCFAAGTLGTAQCIGL